MNRFALLAALCLSSLANAADKPDPAKVKKGLQDIGEFVGTWNLTPEGKNISKAAPKKETYAINWKFKGDDTWLGVDVTRDGTPSTGELRYDPAKKNYTLTLTPKGGKAVSYMGEFKKGKLVLEGKDDKNDVTRFTFVTISDGIRLSVTTDVQKGGSGPFETLYKASGNKEGESLAGGGGAKKPECIVTGGTATMTVSYMGKTYYVCCSGCRDEFNANPKKYVDAYEKSKK